MTDAGNTGGATEGGSQGGTSNTGSGAGTGAAPPAGTNTGGGTEGGTPGGSGSANAGGEGGQVKTFSEEYVKELRAEAAKYRTEQVKTAARLKELEDAQLSEQEKLTKRLKELEDTNSSLQAGIRRSSIESAATAAGALVPTAIVGMVPGDAEDVTAAVNAIKKQFPQLFKPAVGGTADAGGGTSGGGKPANDMNAILRGAAGIPTS